MTDELVQGRRGTDEILPAVTHTIIRETTNYADLPVSDPIMSAITCGIILTSNNYVDLTDTTAIPNITHALTIVNDV